MRIFNRAHVPWFLFVLLATGGASLLYLANFHPSVLPKPIQLPHFFGEVPPTRGRVGGTPLGVIYGSVSLGIFVFAGLLGMRKKIPLWRIGSVQRWLRAHIWLTLLTIPLVLMHSGFRFGGGMTTLLMFLYAIVMISGIYGLVLQHQLPRWMKEHLSSEIVYEQIPFLREQLCFAAEEMRDAFLFSPSETVIAKPATAVDQESETLLVEFIERQVLPYLRARRGAKMRLGRPRFADDTVRFVKLRVAEGYRPLLEQLQGWCAERRLLDLHVRMQHWLHGWILVHAPISFLLILLTAWHAYVALFRY
jgi:hypothetical protein